MRREAEQRGSQGGPRLAWNTVAVLLFGFGVVVAVQLADVSLVGDLNADLILAIGAAQLAGILWIIRLRMVGLGWPKRLASFLALEAALVLVVSAAVPWRALAVGSPEVQRRDGGAANADAPAVDLSVETPHDFASFRGPRRDGVCRQIALARDWSSRPPLLLWRKPVGPGWSSLAVVGEYCVTQEQRGESEAVVCWELRTGRECWVHRDRTRFSEIAGGDGPRATPTIHDGRVYALGATGILNCLDGATGRPVWSVNILKDNGVTNRLFGMSGSPLVSPPLVIVSPGGPGTALVAYDWLTGEKRWSGGEGQASYASPHPADLASEPQVLNFNGDGLYGHRLRDGQAVWHFPWVSNPGERNNVCQPAVLPADGEACAGRVLISSGYGKGCALLEVHEAGGEYRVEPRWSNRNLKAKFTSVVVYKGHVYGLDERILTCLDLATGARRWKRGRYGFGQVLLVGDLLLVQAESGDVVLVEASPDGYGEIARFAALQGRTWTHPVLAGNLLLVRNDQEAACYELPLVEERP